jgi:hypothetical protein
MRFVPVSVALLLASCGPPTSDGHVDVVPEGKVATTSGFVATIEAYGGVATNATLAFSLTSLAEGFEWDPFGVATTIDESGTFAVDLPALLPETHTPAPRTVCGVVLDLPALGVLFAHEGPSEAVTSITGTYGRGRVDHPSPTPGLGTPGTTVVYLFHASDSHDLSCSDWEPVEDLPMDIDLRLRPGWNFVTWYVRDISQVPTVLLRTGEPDLEVPWRGAP